MNTIFVSSTFRDMDLERDVIQQQVHPRLNKIAWQYGQSIPGARRSASAGSVGKQSKIPGLCGKGQSIPRDTGNPAAHGQGICESNPQEGRHVPI